MTLEIKLLDLGRISYADGWIHQKRIFNERRADIISDHLLFAEHNPVITLGADPRWNKVHVSPEQISSAGVDYVQSERGGGTAYLGPGQLIGYTIMNIAPYGGVLNFMIKLEETMIKTAQDFGINVQRRDTHNPTTEKPYRATWYLDEGKPKVLCTKGIKVALAGNSIYTHHGFALNVNRPTQNYFHFVDQCGFPASEVEPIYMSDILGKNLCLDDVKKSIAHNFRKIFAQPKLCKGVLAHE
ncbi:hypothetical protein EXS72_00070 [Candidatus Pacearchaeota archaeon]|nr:hypothetical protein [Candidatus Pacearchaeota archaeon]